MRKLGEKINEIEGTVEKYKIYIQYIGLLAKSNTYGETEAIASQNEMKK